MRRALQFSVIFLCFTLVSCSTKVAYNFLDWAIEWKIGRFVSLHGPQKEKMKTAVSAFHAWHRETQLPAYATYLHSLANRLEQGDINAKEIHAETDKVQLLVDQSIEKVFPDVLSIISDLNDEQVDELLQKVKKERDKYAEEYVNISASKQQKKRYDDFIDYFKPWVGRLDKSQKQAIRDWSRTLLPFEAMNLQQQVLWETQLTSILAKRDDATALEQGLRELMFYRTDNWIPELEEVLDKNQAITYELLAGLVNDLTEKQKAHLLKELKDYAKICEELNREG